MTMLFRPAMTLCLPASRNEFKSPRSSCCAKGDVTSVRVVAAELAVGRPVIVTAEAVSEAALILQEENIGWIARPENPSDLAAAIRLAAADRQETLAKGRRAAVAAERYTYDRAIACYRQIISDVFAAR
jgi:glycosyltransferase involved in cell wall biosynthesis